MSSRAYRQGSCVPHQGCDQHTADHSSTEYSTSLEASTLSLIRACRPLTVTKSTFFPKIFSNSSIIPQNSSRPILTPGENSTRTSTSLSEQKSSRRTDPNSDISRTPWRRQKSVIAARSTGICTGIFPTTYILSRLPARHQTALTAASDKVPAPPWAGPVGSGPIAAARRGRRPCGCRAGAARRPRRVPGCRRGA